jgi:hypothetical protein
MGPCSRPHRPWRWQHRSLHQRGRSRARAGRPSGHRSTPSRTLPRRLSRCIRSTLSRCRTQPRVRNATHTGPWPSSRRSGRGTPPLRCSRSSPCNGPPLRSSSRRPSCRRRCPVLRIARRPTPHRLSLVEARRPPRLRTRPRTACTQLRSLSAPRLNRSAEASDLPPWRFEGPGRSARGLGMHLHRTRTREREAAPT